MRMRKRFLSGAVIILLAGIAVPAVEGGGVEWREYVAEEYAIKFYVAEGMTVTETERGDWGMLKGVTQDGDVTLVVQGVREKKSLEAIEAYAEKELGLSSDRFTKVDGGADDNLVYHTYTARGTVNGVKSGLAVVVAHHATKDISYLCYLQSTAATYDQYQEAFKFWYSHVAGL